MDCTICAFETSRRACPSSRVGGPAGSGAGAPRGRWFLRCVEEPDGLTLHVNLWPGEHPPDPRTTFRAPPKGRPPVMVRPRKPEAERRSRTIGVREEHASMRLRSLTSDRPGSAAYRACTSTSGCMCTESPRPCARAGAPYVAARVAVVPRPHERRWRSRVCGRGGSDPRIRHASYGTATVGMCTPSHPRLGSLRVQQSRAGRPNGEPEQARPGRDRRCRTARRPAGRPTGPPPPPSGARHPSGTDRWLGSDPKGTGADGAQAHPAPNPYQAPRTGGSLPSTPQAAPVPRSTVRRSRKTLRRRRINGKAGAQRPSPEVRIGTPCRLRTQVRL